MEHILTNSEEDSKSRVHKYVVIFIITVATLFIGTQLAVAQDEVIPFVVATAEGPYKFDPLDAYNSDSMQTIMQVCEGLYIYNYSSRELESIPCLAADMGAWSTDAKVLTIHLKEGVTFHDGSIFNASAVKWNFDRLQYWTYGFDAINGTTTGDIYTPGDGILEYHPMGTASKTLFKQGDTVILNRTEIIDEYTIKFVLNLPCVIWEKLLAFIACYIVLPDQDYEYGNVFFNRIDINDELIGTGPFILGEYDYDNQVIFDYNPNYHKSWGDDHIERMIYRIIPDSVTSSLAFLNHEVHWGGVLPEYQDHFDSDPALVTIRAKDSVVYYIAMNLYTMPQEIRLASSFAWNHTYWLEEIRLGGDYELHVPIPDGMQYHHHEYFTGEPVHDLTRAREILLNANHSGIAANISANGLSPQSTTEEWREVAESSTPIASFNFTRYASNTVLIAATLLQDNLKDIGIKLIILEAYTPVWPVDYLENPDLHKQLCYSFGGWRPDYNDPINMIEPLYGTNASGNCFLFQDGTWNDKLIATYSATDLTSPTRRELFYEIQEDFCNNYTPSFYIQQRGNSINFNKEFVNEDSVGDLLNMLSDLYWFNIRFTPVPHNNFLDLLFPIIFSFLGIIGIGSIIGITTYLLIRSKRKKRQLIQFQPKSSQVDGRGYYCPECGMKFDEKLEICMFCGRTLRGQEFKRYDEKQKEKK